DADLRWQPLTAAAVNDPPVYLFRRLLPDAPYRPEEIRPLEIARVIREGHYPPGPIVVTGNDWNPDVAFYAERQAFMIGKQPGHHTGGCDEERWRMIRAAKPVLFIKLRRSLNLCPESI